MNSTSFQWRKAGHLFLLSAIFLLSVLPYLGWTWHRVLPEHTHVFLGTASTEEEEVTALPPDSTQRQDACFNCAEQIHSGTVHLPGLALQILGIAIGLSASFAIIAAQDVPTRVAAYAYLYDSPSLAPVDPPPTVR